MINDAYVIGEAGIAANTAEWPFFRVKEEDVDQLLRDGSLMIAKRGSMVLGCVKVDPNCQPDDARVGEWGMLCVDKKA